MKSSKAFTLVELLVVIAIIAILTAIVTANFAQSKLKSRDAKRVSDVAQIQLALELFFDRCNRYPVVSGGMPSITDGDGSNGCPTGVTFANFISNGVIPTPPIAGDYSYTVNDGTTPTDYLLRAKLESSNAVLNDDVDDGTSFSVDCADASFYYCVIPR